ncbi:sugar kinase [Flammeovirga sp. EKP202]|uniref:sugar kinase n=1 Tax=Flammeovirga sp. EKP202 TaxID=2770592 RepID=UPI00165F4B92|nr:sugar kinase [Flammeovirga sp. EKP202]MBD0403099.1 sugar kinase [Flammeovirga sp. EKP202]
MKKVVTFGELLYRFSPMGNLRFSQANQYEATVGGAEANIAISLAQYGSEVEYVSIVPDNALGQFAVREVKKWGAGVEGVQFGGDKMGMYFLEKGGSLRGGNVIYDRAGASITHVDADTFDWDKILEDADWFHWSGITPALSKGAAAANLAAVETAFKKGIPVSCDLNYRSKLWKYGVDPKHIMPKLLENTTICLANEEDVSKYLGIVPQESDYEEVEGFDKRCYKFISREVMKAFPNLDYVITTLRQTINASHNRWSGVSYDGENFVKGEVHEIPSIIDRVGGGDSFMAAYIHGKRKFVVDKEALDFALAASAYKLSIPGDYNIATEEEVFQIMDKNSIKKINR